MTIVVSPTKPRIELASQPYAPNPSKNYVYQVLYRDVREANPDRALDAGCGELRNFWMFPGAYVGISHNRPGYFNGVRRWIEHKVIAPDQRPEVYLMRLQRAFDFLGLFDLVVCTNTLEYIPERDDVVRRLSQRVARGGSMILEDQQANLAVYLRLLEPEYERIEVMHCWFEGCAMIDDTMPVDRQLALAVKEMEAPNRPEGHARFYLKAAIKLTQYEAAGVPPKIILDDGLRIVEDDVPHLRMA